MKRWNGWGDETVTHPLSASAVGGVAGLVGAGAALQETPFAQALAEVPPSRLPSHPLVSTEAAARLRHARGQSFPDLLALRTGRVTTFPDGVAYPMSGDEVRALLQYARDAGARLIPYGGGTSVVGHINPEPGDAP